VLTLDADFLKGTGGFTTPLNVSQQPGDNIGILRFKRKA
jgi:hypothetical protein